MSTHRYVVEIDAETPEQAEQVLAERLNHDEDYGFTYEIGAYPLAKFEVTVLAIESRFGVDTFVYPTADAARGHLARFVSEWFEAELDEPCPEVVDDDVIAEYFEHVEDDSYILTTTEIGA